MRNQLKNPQMKKYGNSSYWLQSWEDDDILVSTMNESERKSHDIYKLASSKRAISNFVNIVTNQQIPVTFNTRGDSYTDGKTVVIGASVTEPKDFDVAVGLALHEGSHIKLSDFTLLNDIYDLVPQHLKDGAIKKGVTNPITTIKNLWNVVEDRRIDNFIFTSAPGYRDYYRAMYDKYFNDPLIDKALLSDEHTTEELDSYMFRIINIHNKNTDLTALTGLNDIWNVIDLKNISRLKSTKDTFDVALKLFEIILKNLPPSESNSDNSEQNGENDKNHQSGEGDSSEPRDMGDDEFQNLMDSIESQSPMSGDMDSPPANGKTLQIEMPDGMEGGSPSETDSTPNESVERVKLSDRQKELLEKKIQKQKDFMNGEISKKKISQKELQELQAVEESDSELKSVGEGMNSPWGSAQRVQCVVARNLTRSLMQSDVFPMADKYALREGRDGHSQQSVNDGIRIGTILGKKLQVRGEDKNTIFNRQKHGKIDKRMISSLGFGNENVFSYIETDSYKKANLHISIDASGSMSGSKWNKTMTNVVALCKAVDMIHNLSIQVSFRGTTNAGGEKPYIVMAYDSRKDKFSKVKQLFPYLSVGGTTPEGLCYEAIMDEFLTANNDMDSYFLNISDGEPSFSGPGFYYSGESAAKHTNKMVNKIEKMGIKTLSYFVEDYSWGGDKPSQLFISMYGAGARKIDVTNIGQVSKTMNELFLQK
jgi:hypothetical protein